MLIRVMPVGAVQDVNDLDASHATADIVTLKHDIKVDRSATNDCSVVQDLNGLGFYHLTDRKY